MGLHHLHWLDQHQRLLCLDPRSSTSLSNIHSRQRDLGSHRERPFLHRRRIAERLFYLLGSFQAHRQRPAKVQQTVLLQRWHDLRIRFPRRMCCSLIYFI